MAVSGPIGSHFICKLKMEEEIAETHTVKLTAPGLIIDKAGVIAQELTYTFLAGQGLVEQDVGILGNNAGRFKLYGSITSPYFISQGYLKIKKDAIDITIDADQPDGWYGTFHGFRWGSANSSVWSDNSLYYVYNHISGTAAIQITNTQPGIGCIYTGPVSGSAHSVTTTVSPVTITTPGKYTFKVYVDGIWDNNHTIPMPAQTFDFIKNGVSQSVMNTTRRGKRWPIFNPSAYSGDAGQVVSWDFMPPTQMYGDLPLAFPFDSWFGTPTGFTGSVSVSGDLATANITLSANGGSVDMFRKATTPSGATILIRQAFSWV